MEKILICNVSPSPAMVHSGPLGKMSVPGRKPGERYAYFEVPQDLRQPEDMGKGKIKRSLEVDPLAFAQECVRPREERGFFVSIGYPSLDEDGPVVAAERKLRANAAALMLRGDELAAQNAFSLISRQMREAVQILGEKRPWADALNHMHKVPCPACGEPVLPNVAVHGGNGGCGAILDQAKAAKFGLAAPVPVVEPEEPEDESKPNKTPRK